MAVELAEVAVGDGGVEEAAKSAGHGGGKSGAFAVEEVHVVLDAEQAVGEVGGIEHSGDEAAFFLL